ncbi:MAG: Mce-associated rane protein [Mycobacterium sp.]|nr:Mce-associated rane protein [Mycobacterium sp.]
MTAVLEDTAEAEQATPIRYASWGARLGAIALDLLPGIAVVATLGVLAYTTNPDTWLRWTFVAVLALTVVAMVVNRVLLPALTGWTLGRAVLSIRVVRANGQPTGVLRVLLREFAHLLDTAAAFVGWFWPLWDSRRRTFADMLLGTEVRVVEGPKRNVRRLAAVVLAAAALLCVAGTGLGYLVEYRHDRAVDQTRTELTEQGPRIVEQMLSYSKDSMVDDFAKAQALVTDEYRPQLIAQQAAAQKAGVTANEYWAVSSAVLSVEPERGAMLMALQGQRGSDPKDLKFITATVRADFEKIDGRWRVGTLTVLKKPQSNAPSQ